MMQGERLWEVSLQLLPNVYIIHNNKELCPWIKEVMCVSIYCLIKLIELSMNVQLNKNEKGSANKLTLTVNYRHHGIAAFSSLTQK